MSTSIGDLNIKILVEVAQANKQTEQFTDNLKKVETQSKKTTDTVKDLETQTNRLGSTAQDTSSKMGSVAKETENVSRKNSDAKVSTNQLRSEVSNLGYGFVDLTHNLKYSHSAMGDFIAVMGAAVGTGSLLAGTILSIGGAFALLEKYTGYSVLSLGPQIGAFTKYAESEMKDLEDEAYINAIEEGRLKSYADKTIENLNQKFETIKGNIPYFPGNKAGKDEFLANRIDIPTSGRSGNQTTEKVLSDLQKLKKEYEDLKASFEEPFKINELNQQLEILNKYIKGYSDYLKISSGAAIMPGEGGIQLDPREAEIKEAARLKQAELIRQKSIESSERYQRGFEQSLDLAFQIGNVLGLGADSFLYKIVGGLQTGLSMANNFLNILGFFGSGGFSSIFSALGFASGGSVPGSGSGDSVPAMLTPGEFVINRNRASQLGTDFLQWLNGGGSVITPNVAGVSASQQIVVRIIPETSVIKSGNIYQSWRAADKVVTRRKG